MNRQQIWGVLRWFVAALVAGFIGQFGKSLALYLIRHRRSKKAQKADPVTINLTPKTASSDIATTQADSKTQAKIEKKRAKAKAKRLKKS